MKLTLTWLRDHLETSASLSDLCQGLERLGFPLAHVKDWSQILGHFYVVSIRSVVPHPNADRLKVCTVWTGKEELQVVCGGTNVHEGMKTILARPGDHVPALDAPLKKGVIRGVESLGMLCAYQELGLTEEGFEDEKGAIISLPSESVVGSSLLDVLHLNDPIIEIEVTPNRGDMLGVRGIARELSAANLGKLILLDQEKLCSQTDTSFPTFALRYITGITQRESPLWMQRRLRALGIKVISAPVDVTNYLTIDSARPLHVFDADKVSGKIRLERSRGGETFKGLDGQTYILPSEALVIMDDTGIIALAGIIGGESTACTLETRNIWLESAYFSPQDIAKTGQALNIHTDARARFERGVDPCSVMRGLEWGSSFIVETCGGVPGETLCLNTQDLQPHTLSLRPSRIKALSGLSVEDTKIELSLQKLGLETSWDQGILQATVPSWRFDLQKEEDLIEEILRLEGYDHIPSTPLPFRPSMAAQTSAQKRPFIGASFLASHGLQEVVTWSFMTPEKATFWGEAEDSLMLENPLSRDMSLMRPSVFPNLLDLALTHQNRSIVWPGFFEVGPQYEISRTGDISQKSMIVALLSTHQEESWRVEKPIDVFTAKEYVMGLLSYYELPVDKMTTATTAPEWYHPGRKGAVHLGPQALGFFGEIHPEILKKWGIHKRLVGFELLLDRLPQPKNRFPQPYLPLSAYQPVPLDLAFVVDKSVQAESLQKSIQKVAGLELQSMRLFDVFENSQKLGEYKKSFAFRLLFQSLEHTLTDAFIQEKMKIICDDLSQKFGAVLRDGVSQ